MQTLARSKSSRSEGLHCHTKPKIIINCPPRCVRITLQQASRLLMQCSKLSAFAAKYTLDSETHIVLDIPRLTLNIGSLSNSGFFSDRARGSHITLRLIVPRESLHAGRFCLLRGVRKYLVVFHDANRLSTSSRRVSLVTWPVSMLTAMTSPMQNGHASCSSQPL